MTNEAPDRTDNDDDVELLPSHRMRPDEPCIACAVGYG